MNLKKKILNRIFTESQKAVIWKALLYSEMKYRNHGDVDGAARVQSVINDTEHIFGYTDTIYTHADVTNIVGNILDEERAKQEKAYKKGQEVAKEKLEEIYANGFQDCLSEIDKRLNNVEVIKKIDLDENATPKEALKKAIEYIVDDIFKNDESKAETPETEHSSEEDKTPEVETKEPDVNTETKEPDSEGNFKKDEE